MMTAAGVEELTCAVCTHLLRDPVETLCEHLFCESCLLGWLQVNSVCPTCTAVVRVHDLRPPTRAIRNIVENLRGTGVVPERESASSAADAPQQPQEFHFPPAGPRMPVNNDPVLHCVYEGCFFYTRSNREELERHEDQCPLAPNRGDEIYYHGAGQFRAAAHHGIYMGDGEVVHLAGPDDVSGPASSFHVTGTCVVRSTSLDLFKAAARLRESKIKTKVYKHCDPHFVVCARAKKQIGSDFGGFCVVSNNCEHFTTWCKTGEKQSEQVQGTGLLAGVALGMILGGPVGAVIGGVMGVAGVSIASEAARNQRQDARGTTKVKIKK